MAIDTNKAMALIRISADASGVDAGTNAAKKKIRSFGADATKILRNVGGAMMSLGGKVAGGLGIGALGGSVVGAFGVAGVAGDILEVEKALTRLEIASGSVPAEMDEFRAKLMALSNQTGIARKDILAGASAYVALTGDMKGAKESMTVFAQVAVATGATMDDISATAAAMRQNMKIDPKDFQAAFDVLITQGKAGSVELRDLAGLLASLSPKFAKFKGGGGVKGMTELGAAMQVVRQGFGSSSEAATGLERVMVSLDRYAKKLKKKGIRVFDDKGNKRSFQAILGDFAKAKLSQTEMIEIMGSSEAVSALDQLLTKKKLFNQLIADSTNSNATAKDSAAYLASASGRMEVAWTRIKNAIGEALTPERIDAFANAISKLIPVAEGIAHAFGFVEEVVSNLVDDVQKNLRQGERADFHAGRGLTNVDTFATMREEDRRLESLRWNKKSATVAGAASQAWIAKGASNEAEVNAMLAEKIGGAIAREIKVLNDTVEYAGKRSIILKVGGDTLVKTLDNSRGFRTNLGGFR